MMYKIRKFLWRLLGVDYLQILKIQDYVFLKNDLHTNIGEGSYDNGAIVFRWTSAPLKIGKYCCIANNVRFIIDEGYHKSSEITSYPIVNTLYKFETELPNNINKQDFIQKVEQRQGIEIGNDVWIGMNALIMPGLKIGNGVTIAANSVVTKDIEDYAIVGGSPAKLIRYKHNIDQIEQLNKIAWWNWEKKDIKARYQDFYFGIDKFINKYKINT